MKRVATGVAPPRPRVPILQRTEVPAFLDQPRALLLIHSGITTFNENIAKHFRTKKDPWVLAAIDQRICPDGWGEQYVAPIWAGMNVPLRPRVPDGYYLFVDREPTAFHSGRARTRPEPSGPRASEHPVWVIGSTIFTSIADAHRDFYEGANDAIEHFEQTVRVPRPAPAPAAAPTRDAYEVLGLKRNGPLTPGDLRATYHRLIKSAHADQLAGKHPLLVELANTLMREATEAYESIRLERGWS